MDANVTLNLPPDNLAHGPLLPSLQGDVTLGDCGPDRTVFGCRPGKHGIGTAGTESLEDLAIG